MNIAHLTGFLLLLINFSCNSPKKVKNPFAHIPDQKVVTTLEKSFDALGGLDNWQNRKELHYEKQTKLYLESGEIEKQSYQMHDYIYGKNPSINISWVDMEGKKHKITSKNGKAEKYINGAIDTNAKTESLNTSVTTSLFVIAVPFKMIDKGVTLSHQGMDTLEDGQEVEVIKGVYNPATYAHHTTPDTWWYYFDKKDYKLVGYMVQHVDHFSYIKNLEYTTAKGFTFPLKRASYRVTPEREILYTRADYEYKNWVIK